MKKLTKIMLTLAAASVMTAAMAVTAMAEDTFTGSYDNTTGQVTLSQQFDTGKSQTILVLDGNEDIAYINQIDNSGQFATFMLASGLESPTPVTYNIKIGGSDKSLRTGTLTISGSPATVTIIIGDVDGNKAVTAMDITRIKGFLNGSTNVNQIKDTNKVRTKADGTKVRIGDVDDNNAVTAMDITRIKGFLNGSTNVNQIKNTNQEVEVLEVEPTE